jgi:Mor family transcriptional regulator
VSANFDRVASFMRDLGDLIARQAKQQLSMPEAQAVEFGMHCSQQACDEFRGELLYVPMGYALQIAARDIELYAFYEAHGRNIVPTAKQFECSVQTAYRRVRLVELADINERQGGLFDGGNS